MKKIILLYIILSCSCNNAFIFKKRCIKTPIVNEYIEEGEWYRPFRRFQSSFSHILFVYFDKGFNQDTVNISIDKMPEYQVVLNKDGLHNTETYQYGQKKSLNYYKPIAVGKRKFIHLSVKHKNCKFYLSTNIHTNYDEVYISFDNKKQTFYLKYYLYLEKDDEYYKIF